MVSKRRECSDRGSLGKVAVGPRSGSTVLHTPSCAIPPPKTIGRSFAGLAVTSAFCLGWTVWLMLLTAAPNATVNRVLDTETFDEGTFWRFMDPPPATLGVGLGGLSIVALGYLYIIVRVTIFRHRKFVGWSSSLEGSLVDRSFTVLKHRIAAAAVSPVTNGPDRSSSSGVMTRQAAVVVLNLVSVDSSYRKLVNVVLKLVDLAFQIILLVELMESGLPVMLIALFATLTVSNALWTALALSASLRRPGLGELAVDTWCVVLFVELRCVQLTRYGVPNVNSFDIVVAIIFPMTIVLYCVSTFSFDRQVFAINLEVFPPGSYERGASTISDPVETEVIRTAFNSLRVFTPANLIARIAVNASLCRRFHELAARMQNPIRWEFAMYPKKRRLSALFALVAVLVVIFVEESIRTSNIACRPHPECAQNARRWVTLLHGAGSSQCPCLTMIDVNAQLDMYDEWLNPQDATPKVAQLAASGDLQTISLANRQLPTLPDELRRCKNLKYLSLLYTHTRQFPAWSKEFTQLEFLHIETKFNVSSRVDMPADMFDDMAALTFIHFGINDVEHLPSFDGLTNLKSLTLAIFLNLVELPSFRSLGNLERLVLSSLPMLDGVPDLASMLKLSTFVVFSRGAFCCNGFLSECDLSSPMCMRQTLWGSPSVSCVQPNQTATPATRRVFEKFASTVCIADLFKPGQVDITASSDLMDLCNGTRYRQCAKEGFIESMCYNPRLMPVSCNSNPFLIKMRRRQIAEGVGEPCDPEIEAWLGCR